MEMEATNENIHLSKTLEHNKMPKANSIEAKSRRFPETIEQILSGEHSKRKDSGEVAKPVGEHRDSSTVVTNARAQLPLPLGSRDGSVDDGVTNRSEGAPGALSRRHGSDQSGLGRVRGDDLLQIVQVLQKPPVLRTVPELEEIV